MSSYLSSQRTSDCFGCEACVQVCPKQAIQMKEDVEGFRYPDVSKTLCVNCGLCENVCPAEQYPKKYTHPEYAFGGYHHNSRVREQSTSGGAFSALADAWCGSEGFIFGAVAHGLEVQHESGKCLDLAKFRRSKYSQSHMGDAYRQAQTLLNEGNRVLFSGTPCQIAGLRNFLGNKKVYDNLLTVEVVCEGVPSPLFMRKYDEFLFQRFSSHIATIDYRYKKFTPLENPASGKWDFQVMYTSLQNGKSFKKDRWFNPFWSIWLNHLMSRPSCYTCPFATPQRVADITLGDLWGVHLYCPELYGKNGGASLVVCNSEKGRETFKTASADMYGHELDFNIALKYQSPMRKNITMNPDRVQFFDDLNLLDYQSICRKWNKPASLNLLWSKYIWGNRQKVFLWSIFNKA
jgi:coenzyme F420-reducing hydrogenase beta subunit